MSSKLSMNALLKAYSNRYLSRNYLSTLAIEGLTKLD